MRGSRLRQCWVLATWPSQVVSHSQIAGTCSAFWDRGLETTQQHHQEATGAVLQSCGGSGRWVWGECSLVLEAQSVLMGGSVGSVTLS